MQHAILAGIAPPNSGTQKSQQVKNCVVNFYNSAAGQAVQFGSPLGGGAYFYAGKEISAGPAHGFAGAITEFDSRSGLSKGALFEAGGGEGIVGGGGYVATINRKGQPAGSVLAYGGVGVSSSAASASGGVVGFGSGGKVSGAGLYGEGALFGRAVGGGAYVNITNVGGCQ
jgi:hypothetical protein